MTNKYTWLHDKILALFRLFSSKRSFFCVIFHQFLELCVTPINNFVQPFINALITRALYILHPFLWWLSNLSPLGNIVQLIVVCIINSCYIAFATQQEEKLEIIWQKKSRGILYYKRIEKYPFPSVWASFQYKIVFLSIGIPIIKKKRSHDGLICMIRIAMLKHPLGCWNPNSLEPLIYFTWVTSEYQLLFK